MTKFLTPYWQCYIFWCADQIFTRPRCWQDLVKIWLRSEQRIERHSQFKAVLSVPSKHHSAMADPDILLLSPPSCHVWHEGARHLTSKRKHSFRSKNCPISVKKNIRILCVRCKISLKKSNIDFYNYQSNQEDWRQHPQSLPVHWWKPKKCKFWGKLENALKVPK